MGEAYFMGELLHGRMHPAPQSRSLFPHCPTPHMIGHTISHYRVIEKLGGGEPNGAGERVTARGGCWPRSSESNEGRQRRPEPS